MDHCYLEELFGGRVFPDGTCAIDHIDEILEHQKVFMDVVAETRETLMMTFPVLTYCLLFKNGKFVDEEFARWCSDHNCLWYDSNFYNGEDVTTLSNCCFDKSQSILVKIDRNIYLTTFGVLEAMPYDARKNLCIYHNGNWVGCKLIKLPASGMYKVTTMNNKTLFLTDNHINPTLTGDKETKDLTEDDYLLFNTRSLSAIPDQDVHYTYEMGILIGMYLGTGSLNDKNTIILSLNKKSYNDSISILHKAISQIDIDSTISLEKSDSDVYSVIIHNKYVAKFVWILAHNDYTSEKELNMNCLAQSSKFCRGIRDGLYLTSGTDNTIYITSEKLVHQIEALCTSFGDQTIISSSDSINDLSNSPLYCIHWYNTDDCRGLDNVYKVCNNSIYFKIKSIEKIENYNEPNVYCFQMTNEDDPYFTLPNGIITHNCRLLSDTSKLTGFINSIGGTALSVGSCQVNTINLRRIALETGPDEDKYIALLHDRVDNTVKVLDVIRHIIQRNIEKGLLPNYSYGLVELSKQYNTIGITCMFETMKEFGYISQDEFGNYAYTDNGIRFASKIMDVINEQKESYGFDYSLNIENIPAERANVILASKDAIIYPDAEEYYLYSNQWIPLMERCTLQEKVRLGSILDKMCGGGQISHIQIEAPFQSKDQAWEMLNYIASQGVIYFAFNVKISVCSHGHAFYGETCPTCGEPKADTYTRVVGFLTPVSGWSKERRREFDERKWFNLNDSVV